MLITTPRVAHYSFVALQYFLLRWDVAAVAAVSVANDLTTKPDAVGEDVVKNVIHKIGQIFGDDKDILRRMACTVSNYGNSSKFGGIWQISDEMLEHTKRMKMIPNEEEIRCQLEIQWNTTEVDELRKPLISGLAARILLGASIPDSLPAQVDHVLKLYGRSANDKMFASQFEQCAYNRSKLCPVQMDVCIMVDASGSIGENDFQRSREFVRDFLNETASEKVRAALVVFSEITQLVHPFSNNTLKIAKDVMDPRKTPYLAAGTHTSKAIEHCIGLFREAPQHDSFTGSPKINLLLTDGQSNGPQDNSLAVALPKAAKANITYSYAVGVGPAVNEDELLLIAANNKEHVFKVSSPEGLAGKIRQLSQTACLLPIVPTVDVNGTQTTTNETLRKEETRIICLNLDEKGLEICATVPEGKIQGYYAYEWPYPSRTMYDGQIPGGKCTLIPSKASLKNRQSRDTSKVARSVYISIVGLEERNTFTLTASPQKEPAALKPEPAVNVVCDGPVVVVHGRLWFSFHSGAYNNASKLGVFRRDVYLLALGFVLHFINL